METFLGVLGLVLFIVAVIGFAASVTWAVVRLTPERADADSGGTSG